MARMIDARPDYQGEAKVWDSVKALLPEGVIAYNNREINGREYDLCLLIEGLGILIIEVKGWLAKKLDVRGVDKITIEGYDKPQRSPKKQARAYRFALLNSVKERYCINPLVIDMVCYPFISKAEYLTSRLDIVSESKLTIFKEDMEDQDLLYGKIRSAFQCYEYIPHDNLSGTLISMLRSDWESEYNESVLSPTDEVKPYSLLSSFTRSLSLDETSYIVNSYFQGVKQVVFVNSKKSYRALLDALNKAYKKRNIQPGLKSLRVGYEIPLTVGEKTSRAFNLEVYLVDGLENIVTDSFSVEEGRCSEEELGWLELLSSRTTFNYQQFLVEHALTSTNSLVEAGAGTGKTYSMVSRVAFLCNKRDDSVSSLSDEVAMMTFTNDAATNMRVHLKQMFINYFILTGKPRHLKFADEVDLAHISTIHSFAIGLLRNEVLYSGLGTNFRITSNELLRSSIYDEYLNIFIDRMVSENPDFLNEMPVPIYDLKRKLMAIADRLLAKSTILSKISPSEMGVPARRFIPYFNNLIEKVLIPAETVYSDQMHLNNNLDLKEAIIQLESVLSRHSGAIKNLKFRFLFIDEFQDTDDVQIKAFSTLQKLIDAECRFFIVGDLKQSIYRFRGATISAFDSMREKCKYGWSSFVLTINYRTDCRLLDRYHLIFTKMGNSGILPYDDSADKLVSSVIKELDDESVFTCVPCNCKDDRAFAEQFASVLQEQAEILDAIIRQRNKLGSRPLNKEERTIAILVRSNWQVEKLVRAGKSAGIVIETKTGGDLFQLESSVDMYKLVMALRDSSNPIYLVNLIESNLIALSLDYQMYKSASEEKRLKDLTRILDEAFGARVGKTWQQVVADAYTQPILFVIKSLYDALQPWKQCSNRHRDQEHYIVNYEYLVERIIESMRIDSLTLNQVAEYLRVNIVTQQERQSRSLDSDDSGISIVCTTVHKSKGLEYGTVILPFTYEDISSTDRVRTDANYTNNRLSYIATFDGDSIEYNTNFSVCEEIDEQKKEEARILYVALTRAIRNCVWMKNLDSHPIASWGTFLEV